MKNRILLIYGYLVPFIGVVLFSMLPVVLPFISYLNICKFYNNNYSTIISILAFIFMLIVPFQIKIINEDNPDVIIVLDKSNIREVFIKSSIYQAILILLCVFIMLILASSMTKSVIIGYFELLLTLIIVFEGIAMISNGMKYQKIRQKIIVETHKAKILGGNDNKYPPSPNADE